MREFKEGTVMIEKVRKNFEKITKEEVEMAKLSRETQAKLGIHQIVYSNRLSAMEIPKIVLLTSMMYLTLVPFLVHFMTE